MSLVTHSSFVCWIGDVRSFLNLISRKIFLQRWKHPSQIVCPWKKVWPWWLIETTLHWCAFENLPNLQSQVLILTNSFLQNSLNIYFFLVGSERRVCSTNMYCLQRSSLRSIYPLTLPLNIVYIQTTPNPDDRRGRRGLRGRL